MTPDDDPGDSISKENAISNVPPQHPSSGNHGLNLAHGPLLAVIFVACLVLAAALAGLPFEIGAGLVIAIVVFILCFINTEVSLYVLVFSMLLSPEFGVGGLSDPNRTTAGRGVTLRTEDLLLVVMAFAWLTRMAVHKELGLVRSTALNRPIGYYTAACILATSLGMIFGSVTGVTAFFFVLKYIEYFVIYFVVANNIHTREQIKRFTVAMLLTAVIVCFVAIAQIPTGQRVAAPFEGEQGEPNTLGGYLLFIAALAGGLIMQLRTRSQRIWLIGLLTLIIVPFLATLSRGSYLAAPFVYAAFIVLNKSLRTRLVMIIALFAISALGVAVMPQTVKDRISHTWGQSRQSHLTQVQVGDVRLDTSTSQRLESWQGAFADALYSPIWGYGVTGYKFLDAQYPRVLAETGLLGVVAFGALVVGVFREARNVFERAKDPLFKGLAAGLLAGTVGLLVHAVGANTFIIVRIMEPFWLAVGLVVCASGIMRAEEAEVVGGADDMEDSESEKAKAAP